MLRPLRDEWDMAFVGGGPEALEHLAREPVDVLVTDMRMPGMDGVQLLTEVMQRSPGVVRIVLSGQADEESMLRALAATHQYLMKPCDPDTLKSAVASATAARSLLSDTALTGLVTEIQTLPSPPSVFFEETATLKGPDVAMPTASQIIAEEGTTNGRKNSVG
jgi:DNA-binding NtrC family response regulator